MRERNSKMSNFEETNLGKMFTRLKIYYKAHPNQIKIQVGIIFLISTVVCGQAGQSLDLLTSGKVHSNWNPIYLLYYAWIRMFLVTFLINVAANTVILYVKINKEKTLHDKERNFDISEKGTMGTGGFMQANDKTKALIMDEIENINGAILGRDPETKLICSPKKTLYINNHKVVCGGSGARKTTTQVLNELFQVIKRNESFIVTDPKGEIYEMLSVMVEKRGYKTKVLNLVNLENSDGIDFLKSCRDKNGKQDKEIEAVQTLVKVIMANTTEDKTDGFWDDNQKGLLTAAMLYVMYDTTGQTEPTLAGTYEFLLKTDKAEIDRKFENLDNEHPAKAPYLLYARPEAKVRDSVINGLLMRLQIFQTNAAKRIVSSDEIDITLPSKEKCAYFVIMSDQTSTFDFIASLFFSMFFIKEVQYVDSLKKQVRESEELIPVNLVMDEFPSIGTIPDFGKKLATVRSRKINITIIFQNYGQLMDKYKDNQWETIVANCDTNIYLGGNDSEKTVDYYYKRLGEMTVLTKGKRTQEKLLSLTDNKFHPSYGTSESESSRPVMTKDELLRMPTDEALVLMKSCRPLKVLKFVYTEHPMAAEIVERNPTIHVPEWRRQLEGYPDLPDNELEYVNAWLEDGGRIKEYLDLHEDDKTYCLMDYLYDVYREEYIRLKNALERKTGEPFSVQQEQIDNQFIESENAENEENEKSEKMVESETENPNNENQPSADVDDSEKETDSGVTVKRFNITGLKNKAFQKGGSGKENQKGNTQGGKSGNSDTSESSASSNTPQRANLSGWNMAKKGDNDHTDKATSSEKGTQQIDPSSYLAFSASSNTGKTENTPNTASPLKSRMEQMKEEKERKRKRFSKTDKDQMQKEEEENEKRLKELQKQDDVQPVQEEQSEEPAVENPEAPAADAMNQAFSASESLDALETVKEAKKESVDEINLTENFAPEQSEQENTESNSSSQPFPTISNQNVVSQELLEDKRDIDDFEDFDSSVEFSLPEATGTEMEDEEDIDIVVDTAPEDINVIPDFDKPSAAETEDTQAVAQVEDTQPSAAEIDNVKTENDVSHGSEVAEVKTKGPDSEAEENHMEGPERSERKIDAPAPEDNTTRTSEIDTSSPEEENPSEPEPKKVSESVETAAETEMEEVSDKDFPPQLDPLFSDVSADKKRNKNDFTMFSASKESNAVSSGNSTLKRPADMKRKGIRQKISKSASKEF